MAAPVQVSEGWVVFSPHVFPLNDRRVHCANDCWCDPTLLEDGTVVHQSADRREEYENGRSRN